MYKKLFIFKNIKKKKKKKHHKKMFILLILNWMKFIPFFN